MAAAQPQAAIDFALAPALVNADALIDYNTPAGAKLYERAVKPLSPDDLYDLSSDRLTVFLADLDDRIVASGWEGIFSIPEDAAAAAPVLRMLTTDYGVVTLDQIRAHAETYLPNNDRNCQNAFQAFNCLMNSLDNKAKMRINLRRDLFVVDGVGHGPLLLKVIVQTAYVDTRSTVLHLREQLSRLDMYIKDVKSDVEVFNDHVRTMVSGLEARGEQTLDLLANLFKGYMCVTDSSFVEFIKRKKDAYEEGEIELTPEQLMESAANKFNALKQSGRWQQASEQDEKIIALQAKIKLLEEKRNKKTKNKTKEKGNQKKPAWLTTPPKDGESEEKTSGGKTYYWCARHGKWSLNSGHTTATCRGFGLPENSDNRDSTHRDSDQQNSRAIRLAAALARTTGEDSDDESEASE